MQLLTVDELLELLELELLELDELLLELLLELELVPPVLDEPPPPPQAATRARSRPKPARPASGDARRSGSS
jgi:hypothetical protein